MEYAHLVPKDHDENLAWRADMLERSAKDLAYRAAIKRAAAEDPLFFFNALCWVFEPRPMPKWLPFITWPHQDRAILTIEEYLGQEDIGLEKARAEGATWMAVTICLRHWLFTPMFAAGFVSRSEDAVDKANDPGSLMWKVDKQLEKMPVWLRPKFKRGVKDHSLINLDNEATMIGYAASANVGSGDRKTVFVMDELAKFGENNIGADQEAMDSTFPVTDCRLIMSTPKGSTGAYYDAMHTDSNMVKVVLDWKENPTKNIGLYRVVKGEIELLDEANPLPEGYREKTPDLWERLKRRGFRVEGTVRSPWYDKQCFRTNATPQSIAQELDRDYGGSGYPYFDGGLIDSLKQEAAQQPTFRGDLHFNPETITFSWVENPDGPLKIWAPLVKGIDGKLCPKVNSISMGVDISHGTGGESSSYSAAVGFERETGKQVFTYATQTIPPIPFADLCIGLSLWFRGVEQSAFMVPEANGPTGAAFIGRLVERNFSNVYRRMATDRYASRRTPRLGWWQNANDKAELLGQFRGALADRRCIPRDLALIEEFPAFVFDGGKVNHVRAKLTNDESAKGASHGDRTIAAACGWLGCLDMPAVKEDEPTREAEYGSFAWRNQQIQKKAESSSCW